MLQSKSILYKKKVVIPLEIFTWIITATNLLLIAFLALRFAIYDDITQDYDDHFDYDYLKLAVLMTLLPGIGLSIYYIFLS
jgi:hypothetical protein